MDNRLWILVWVSWRLPVACCCCGTGWAAGETKWLLAAAFGIALFAVAGQTGFSVRVWGSGVAGFPAKRYAIGASALANVGARMVKVQFSVAS